MKILFNGGGRIFDKAIQSIGQAYGTTENLRDLDIDVIISENRETSNVKSSIIADIEGISSKIKFTAIDPDEFTSGSRNFSEYEVVLSLFGSSDPKILEMIKKSDDPRKAILIANIEILKNYARSFVDFKGTHIVVSNPPDILAKAFALEIKNLGEPIKTIEEKIIPYGVKSDFWRIKRRAKDIPNPILDLKGREDKLRVCGIHGSIFVIIDDLLNDDERERLNDKSYFISVLKEQYLLDSWMQFEFHKSYKKHGYVPDPLIGPNLAYQALYSAGANIEGDYFISDYDASKPVPIDKIINQYYASKEDFMRLDQETREIIFPYNTSLEDSTIEKLSKEFAQVYCGYPQFLGKLSGTDAVLAYRVMHDILQMNNQLLQKQE